MTTKSPPQPIGEVIADLEAAALAGHSAGLTWTAFFAGNVGTITVIIRDDPAGWPNTADRLLALLVSGETSGQHPAGDSLDQDEARIPVVRLISDTLDEAPVVVPPFHPDALDLDLLAFFGGQWGAFCPWPTPQQAAADLREFFGGANDTATAARLEPGIFPQVTQ